MIRRFCTLLALAVPTIAGAQTAPPADAQTALAACMAAAENEALDENERKRRTDEAAGVAERLFRAAIDADSRDVEARVGLAQTLARCRIPFASVTRILGVVEESNELLESALALDADHWSARFSLAMNHFHTPAFLGRRPQAVKHLEELVRRQAAQPSAPHHALAYAFLGDAYDRTGRAADAARTWREGAARFPDQPLLQARVAALPSSAVEDSAASPAGAPEISEGEVFALAPLTVEVAQHQLEDARSGTALRRIDVLTMPGGTAEMLQALQSLPGATRAGDGANLYIRGGDPEETPVFVDGGRMVYPGRWETLDGAVMGSIDATAVRRTYFAAGGFSAKYGNALSGVVDIETQGRPANATYRVGANLVQLGATALIPLGTAGVWGNVGATDTRLVAEMNGEGDLYPKSPRSVQGAFGVALEPRSGVELRAALIGSVDAAARLVDVGGYSGAFESDGSSLHGALSARWLRGDARAGISASVSGSMREGSFAIGVLDRERTDRAATARVDGDVVIGGRTRLRTGLEAMLLDARTDGSEPLTAQLAPGSPATDIDRETESTHMLGGYIEVDHSPVPGLGIVVGTRVDRLPGEDAVTLDPRVALAYSSGDWTLRTGAGVFHQGAWRRAYRLPEGGSPAAIATRARHLIAGFERSGEPSLRVEGYWKRYDDFVAEEPAIRSSTARGIDAIVRWSRRQRLNGWITYSLLDSRLRFADGATAPGAYDVRHSLTAVGRLAAGELWEVGATARFGSGRPYTPVVGTQVSQPGWPVSPVFGDAHSERLPDHIRLDGRITRYIPMGNSFGVLYLEMLNLLNRRNVMRYTYSSDYATREPMHTFFAHRTLVLGIELQSERR